MFEASPTATVMDGLPTHPVGPAAEVDTLTAKGVDAGALLTALIAKFPDFQTNWSPDVQQVWFTAFSKLVKETPPEDLRRYLKARLIEAASPMLPGCILSPAASAPSFFFSCC